MEKWNIGWGPVSKCNMNCKFCYSRHRRTGCGDLCLSEWKSFVDGNHERIATINYGTGENAMDPDWFELIAYVRERYPGIRQALTTNGFLAPAVASNLSRRTAFLNSIDEVDVSLDFYDKNRHCDLRGQPMAYDWALETLRLCKQAGKPTTIVFIGSAVNLIDENIDGLFSIAEEYDAILRMNLFRPTQGVDGKSREFIAGYDQVVSVLKHIADRFGILAINDALYSARLTGCASADPSGLRSIRILADGSITPSTYLIDDCYVVANIREPDALLRLENRDDLSHIIHRLIPAECKGCALCDVCAGGVYDRRYLWHGTLERRDPHCPGPIKEGFSPMLHVARRTFVSVHDGYLPTMFFTVKHDEEAK